MYPPLPAFTVGLELCDVALRQPAEPNSTQYQI